MIKKIISGGQPGVERAALDAAIKLNIPHKGWTYRTRRTDEGILPDKYRVKESEDISFSDRIEKNVLASDATARSESVASTPPQPRKSARGDSNECRIPGTEWQSLSGYEKFESKSGYCFERDQTGN